MSTTEQAKLQMVYTLFCDDVLLEADDKSSKFRS